MADKKSSKPNASLSGLLEEHALIAEREKAEIESRLREREEAEKRVKDEAEARERALLQERLEAEKKRQRERLERQRKRAGEEDEEASAGKPVVVTETIQAPPQSAAGKVTAGIVVTALLVAGAAVGAYFMFFADNSQALAAVSRQGKAMFEESKFQAEITVAKYEAEKSIEALEKQVADLSKDLAETKAANRKSGDEKTTALQEANDKIKTLEDEMEKLKTANPRPRNGGRKRPPKDKDRLDVKPGLFSTP